MRTRAQRRRPGPGRGAVAPGRELGRELADAFVLAAVERDLREIEDRRRLDRVLAMRPSSGISSNDALDVVPAARREVGAHEVGRQAALPDAVAPASRERDAALDRLLGFLPAPRERQQVGEVHACPQRAAVDARLLGEHERLSHQAEALVRAALEEERLVDQGLHDDLGQPEPLGELERPFDVRDALRRCGPRRRGGGRAGRRRSRSRSRRPRPRGRASALSSRLTPSSIRPVTKNTSPSRTSARAASASLAGLAQDLDCLLEQRHGLVEPAAHDRELARPRERAAALGVPRRRDRRHARTRAAPRARRRATRRARRRA